MINIDVRSNLRTLTRSLNDLTRKQVPFAIAQALNSVAKRVKAAEEQNIRATFKKPTPFTQNSLGVSRASKANPVATVFVKSIAAKYLAPYETGGVHKLNSRALLNPKNLKLNQYGQLPKAVLASLKARPDIFIGRVKTKAGMVNGVWQRVTDAKRVTLLNSKGKRLRGLNRATAQPGHLKLILRFGDALPVNKKLNYGLRAKQVVERYLAADFNAAIEAALRTAR
ncbi:hypothetical protein [Janthinobacterium sp.]|uniref:hypothetical protein n=1 Tax=Janthinobacterium sp. TaxID=1871054 RepID=UPI00293D6568|nr:hypothetical protein [Janthinobacterium sp.]